MWWESIYGNLIYDSPSFAAHPQSAPAADADSVSSFFDSSDLIPRTSRIFSLATWSPGDACLWSRRTFSPPAVTISIPPFCMPSPFKFPLIPNELAYNSTIGCLNKIIVSPRCFICRKYIDLAKPKSRAHIFFSPAWLKGTTPCPSQD